MIVKVQPSRKHSSSFKRLHEYLTQERDAETGELVLRGDVVLSWNLLSFDTAAGEMQGVASLNDRCKDAVCHYELSWPPGERPTRPQWTDSALQTLKALGYEDHQYMVVAHDDKKHFHIHIMVNKVHPQTLRAPTRYNNWLALDAAARLLEAKYGWAHTPGMTRWDEESKQAVPISRSERNALRTARQQPTGAAANLNIITMQESLQSYVRREVAPVYATSGPTECHVGPTSIVFSQRLISDLRKGIGRIHSPCHRPQHPGERRPTYSGTTSRERSTVRTQRRSWALDTRLNIRL
jgi:hypothetical protein